MDVIDKWKLMQLLATKNTCLFAIDFKEGYIRSVLFKHLPTSKEFAITRKEIETGDLEKRFYELLGGITDAN